jgi:hypothetical protein
MFVTPPLLGENEAPGCPIQRALENDFVVVAGTSSDPALPGRLPKPAQLASIAASRVREALFFVFVF